MGGEITAHFSSSVLNILKYIYILIYLKILKNFNILKDIQIKKAFFKDYNILLYNCQY